MTDPLTITIYPPFGQALVHFWWPATVALIWIDVLPFPIDGVDIDFVLPPDRTG